MRKFIGVLLSVLCICCAAIGLTGCKKDKHIHAFDKQVITDEYKATDATCTEAATYYYSCECGEKGAGTFEYGSPLGHSFTNYVSDNNATCTQDGTKTAKCDRCNVTYTITDNGSAKGHTEVIDQAKAATCTETGLTEGKHCSVCNTVLVKQNVVLAKGHTYSEEWSQSETEHWHSATCGHNVEKDRATHTFDENKKCTVCDYITVKPLGLELQSSVFNIDKSNKTGYLKVANAVTDYDFSDKFTVADGARFDVCTDKECNNKIPSKKTDIVAGDNIFYILVTNGNDVASYTITLRRRPLYTVSFNANGGTAVNSQTVEEDAIIPEPVTTRAGYTFISWSYDFTQPIMEDTDITATWIVNTDTAYKVEYYLENIDDADYSLYETSNLQGTTDTTATAEIKTYDHFTFNKNKGMLSGNVSGDGSLVLKVYYARNTYTLSNANTYYGEITNATTKKYGSNITSVATEYLGYEFLGWYNGEELLSVAKEFTFTVEYNVIAKFKVKDKMSNFNFYSSVDTCNITGLKNKTVSEIIIPDYVTSIYDSAFYNCSGLTNVTIGNSVTSIGNKAFFDCSVLTSVTIPDSVTAIGSQAFYYCSGLTSVTIGGSVTSIGGAAFSGCSSLTSITIGNSVTSIGGAAFSGCSSLTSITIGSGVTSIGSSAFSGCSGLTSVTIPDSVTSIGENAFSTCSTLTSVTWNAKKCTEAGSYENPIFEGCKNLATVTIGENVKYIPVYTFWQCSSAIDLYISDLAAWCGITGGAMSYAPNNKNFYLNGKLVAELKIPDSVTSIGGYAFSGCSGLTNITIPDSVTFIGDGAFRGCNGLTSVTIPDSVTFIGDGAFSGCSGIESLVVTTGNKKYHSANNCIIETETKKLITGCKNSVIPTDDGVTSIGYMAFYYCSGLTSVTIPDSVTSIGESAFYGCRGLTSVTIGNGVTSIGDYAFEYCSGLKNITYKGTIADWKNIAKGGSWNYGVPTDCVIHCTDGDIKISY